MRRTSKHLLVTLTCVLLGGVPTTESGAQSPLPPPPVESVEESADDQFLELLPPQMGFDVVPPTWSHDRFDPPHPSDCVPFIEVAPLIVESPIRPLENLLAHMLHAKGSQPALTLSNLPLEIQPVPERPPLLWEWNEWFLDSGPLPGGIQMPTGAVWRPSIWVFGTHRTGVSYFDDRRGTRTAEWANRLDLFGQWNLSGTERVLIGLRPLDEEREGRRAFSGFDFRQSDATEAVNAELQTLFFEGELDELFPQLDPLDSRAWDLSVAIGRQPLLAQQGLLVNEDRIDGVALTRNNLNGWGMQNLRVSTIFAWDGVNRTPIQPSGSTNLYAVLSETDWDHSTTNLDVVYADASSRTGSVLAYGASLIRRLVGVRNTYNASLHVLGSFPVDTAESEFASRGTLLFSQFSWEPRRTSNLVYFNAFCAIDEFTSPARGTLAGGPLGQTGLLFSAAGLGRYGAALNNRANDAVGGSLGYQLYFDETRQQVVFEAGARQATSSRGRSALAAAIRHQVAIGPSQLVRWEAFVAGNESTGVSQGARVELTTKF